MFHRVFLLSAAIPILVVTTVSTEAQIAKPLDPAPVNSALDRALDKRELALDRRAANPGRPPQTVEISVSCGSPAPPFNSINGALAKLNPNGVNVIHVSGTCNENVTVQSFENLTLIANPGASINDPSGGNVDTLDVADTREFSLQGFTITGGGIGVACFEYSLCRLTGNTVRGSFGDGILVSRAEAALQGDTVENNAGRGVAAINGGVVRLIGETLANNGAAGAIANAGSNLVAANVVSQNNGAAGIRIANHSTLRLIDSTMTGNAGQGVVVDTSSEAFFDTAATGNVITGNSFAGVRIGDLSFVLFGGTDNITGNQVANPGGFDVVCAPQFSATRGALTSIGGGTTNCVEP